MAFNIYFERDPSVDPGTGNSGCANPSSVIYAKCALWGGPLNSANANNKGQMRNQFEVAIAGSNAYQNNSLTIPAGYSLKAAYNNVAINAPYDAQGFNTYMGATIFSTGPFNIQLCADYCSAQTKYNLANPASDGTPSKSCNFFNTYILYKNDASSPQGQYCSIYTEQWPDSYAVNSGQTRGNDRYFIGYSYTFANSTSAAIAPTVGDKNGAIYQARQDMTYYPSSLTSTFLPYCSSLLGYTPILTTSVPSATVTPLTTVTVVATVTALAKRDGTVSNINPTPINGYRTTPVVQKRGLSTPNVLSKYPVAVQSAACSLIATSSATTSTITAATVTVTLATQTSTVSTTTSVAAAVPTGLLKVQNTDSSLNGLYLTFKTSIAQYGGTFITLTSDANQASTWTIDSSSGVLLANNRAFAAEQNPASPGYSVDYDSLFMLQKGYSDAAVESIPQATCQVSGGILACTNTGGRNIIQLCPDLESLFGTYYGTGSYLVLSDHLGDGCEATQLVFTQF